MSAHTIKFLGRAKDHIDEANPVKIVEQAIGDCRGMVIQPSREISDIRIGSSGVRDSPEATKKMFYESHGRSFPMFFGWDDTRSDATLRHIERHFAKISKRIDDGLTVKLRPATGWRSGKCSDASNAFQFGGWTVGSHTINLCPRWFGKDREYRAAVIAHEMCHAIGGPGGRTDLKDVSGNKVYERPRTVMFAHMEPDRACYSAENYEQFLVYREELKDRRKYRLIGENAWPGLVDHVDAAVHAPNGFYYFFKGSQYWRWNPDTHKFDNKAQPFGLSKNGKPTGPWQGVPTDIDAAVTHPNGKIYFFKGDCYWRYDPADGVKKVDHDAPKKIGVDGWFGIKPGMDAAVVFPGTNLAHFYYGPTVTPYRFRSSNETAGPSQFIRDIGYPEPLWGSFNAVLPVTSTSGNVRIHFFLGDRVVLVAVKDITLKG